MRVIFLIFAILFQAQALAYVDFDVRLFHDNAREKRAELVLEKLNQNYDLRSISYTKNIIIKSNEIAHSHPVLTLNTRYIDNEVAFFSVFIHEQIHWHLSQPHLQINMGKFLKEVEFLYPNIAVGRDQGGARTRRSSYLHLAVIFLEFEMLSYYVGLDTARDWMLENTVYSSLNKLVVHDYDLFKKLISKFELHLN